MGIAAGFFAANRLLGAGPLQAEKVVWVQPGTSGAALSAQLVGEGVISDRYSFLLALRVQTSGHDIKAGEYRFGAYQPLQSVIEQLRRGDVIVRQVTVPEGRTSAEIVAMLLAEPLLTGAVTAMPPEGSLLPETYNFERGADRNSILLRMKRAMDRALAEAWAQRAADAIVTTPQQALILASIIEKETGMREERRRVSGVYQNRLKIGMRLQADPTVVYGVTLGAAPLGRDLTYGDLAAATAYNTYAIDGLPPGPIANPGRASLVAAVQPEAHKLFYFVADGTGGHVFARTLDEHNRNVAKWRKIKRDMAKDAAK